MDNARSVRKNAYNARPQQPLLNATNVNKDLSSISHQNCVLRAVKVVWFVNNKILNFALHVNLEHIKMSLDFANYAIRLVLNVPIIFLAQIIKGEKPFLVGR